MTPELLQAVTGCTPSNAAKFCEPLGAACAFYGIDTPARLAAFLAQVGHESGSLRYTTELWGPTPAQARYEGRKDLGNTEPGDGARFRGHGLIQTTGRHNHRRVRDRLRERFPHLDVPDFEAAPELLALPQWAALSAADYWDERGCNALADAGKFEAITRAINGGLNGWADRLARWSKAKAALGGQDRAQAAPTPADQYQPTTPAPSAVPEQEKPVLPFIAAALPYLIQAAPSLIRVFGDSPQAEKNAKAAEVVAQVAMQATGETTAEGAVQAIQQDPAKAAAYREAVHQSMGELMGFMAQAQELDEKSRDAATGRAVQLGQVTGGKWLWLLGAVALIVVGVSYGITWGVLFFKDGGFGADTKALILGQVVILGFTTVLAFLFGSNIQNRLRDQQDRQDRQPQG